MTTTNTDPAVADLLAFLKFPSVSTDPARAGDVRDCAGWVANKLRAIGLLAEVHDTAGHPVVLGRSTPHRADLPTVLIYGHYDVQPADPLDLWHTPPFEPRIENGVVFARGATDNKGQILAHIRGVEAALLGTSANGFPELPVNVIFLIEGEEEIGSPNLEPFLREHREELQCDVIAISDTTMVGTAIPTFTYCLRGLTALEVHVTGPAMDLHSGIFGGAVANPATALARLLASLHDADGHVAVAGFYDAVQPLADWEREAWKALPLNDEHALLALTGASATFGEAGFTSIERFSARPTAEINGFASGYQGEGSKTIIPAKASAKLTFRLVPDQDPAKIQALVTEHLFTHCPPGVKLDVVPGHSGRPYACDPHSAFGQAAQRALRHTFPGKEPALIREGGSIPIVTTFREVLGVETLLLGLALPDCRAHSPNENFPLANYFAGIRLNQVLLREIGATKR
ncbi:MAG: dipeptidase [Verrucomicrobia bacterium]|nr:dipeptidase [Verrucomicrobiota bacterium]